VARSDERISVAVEHGVVDVQFRGRMAAVGVNQRWSSESPGQIATITSTAPQAGIPAPSEPATNALDITELETPSPASQAHRPGTRPTAKPGSKLDTRTEPKPDPAHTGDQAPVDRDRAEYDRLAALEPHDPDAALAGYLALVRGTSRWADPALFAAARLAVDRHDRRAETLLEIYLQRFPSGANATDAKQLLTRLKADSP
jgi:hypothetical protein